MTIADKLTLLASSKEALRVKLGLPKSLPFSEYYKHSYPFDPMTLFAGGNQGVWLDPSDLSTMFQDIKGRTPVTKNGDPVGLILDKSQGLELKDVTSLVSVIPAGVVTTEPTEDGVRYTVLGGIGGVTIRDTDPLKTYKVVMTYSLEGAATWYQRDTLEEGTDKKVEFISGPEDYGYRLYIRGDNYNITVHSLEVFEITGNHATQTVSTARPIYKTDGILHWLQFDGVDDYLLTTGTFETKNLFISTLITQPVSGVISRTVATRYILRTATGYRYHNMRGVLHASYNVGNKDIFTFNTSLDGSYIRLNSEVVSNDLAGSFDLSAPYFIGSSVREGNAEGSLGGNIYGVIATEDLMSDNKVVATESYLSAKSGVIL